MPAGEILRKSTYVAHAQLGKNAAALLLLSEALLRLRHTLVHGAMNALQAPVAVAAAAPAAAARRQRKSTFAAGRPVQHAAASARAGASAGRAQSVRARRGVRLRAACGEPGAACLQSAGAKTHTTWLRCRAGADACTRRGPERINARAAAPGCLTCARRAAAQVVTQAISAPPRPAGKDAGNDGIQDLNTGAGGGGFTNLSSEVRRIVPDAKGRPLVRRRAAAAAGRGSVKRDLSCHASGAGQPLRAAASPRVTRAARRTHVTPATPRRRWRAAGP
jgi:hypothetical protein